MGISFKELHFPGSIFVKFDLLHGWWCHQTLVLLYLQQIWSKIIEGVKWCFTKMRNVGNAKKGMILSWDITWPLLRLELSSFGVREGVISKKTDGKIPHWGWGGEGSWLIHKKWTFYGFEGGVSFHPYFLTEKDNKRSKRGGLFRAILTFLTTFYGENRKKTDGT